MNKLTPHLRQYKHNNNNGLIPAYEKKGTETLVACLEGEIADLKEQVSDLTLSKTFVSVSLTKLQILHNKRVGEVLSLTREKEAKDARTLGRISRIERQEDEISALKDQIDNMVKFGPNYRHLPMIDNLEFMQWCDKSSKNVTKKREAFILVYRDGLSLIQAGRKKFITRQAIGERVREYVSLCDEYLRGQK